MKQPRPHRKVDVHAWEVTELGFFFQIGHRRADFVFHYVGVKVFGKPRLWNGLN